MATTLQMRTADEAWARAYGKPGPDGRTVIQPGHVERVTFAGQPMLRCDLRTVAPTLPADAPSPWLMVPVEWPAK